MCQRKQKSLNSMNEENNLKSKINYKLVKYDLVLRIICFILTMVNFTESLQHRLEVNSPVSSSSEKESTKKVWRALNGTSSERSLLLEVNELCFQSDYDQPCNIACKVTAKDRKSLINWLEKQQKLCSIPLNVVIYESSFPGNTFSEADLNGAFSFDTLLISLNALIDINEYAFNKPSMGALRLLDISQNGVNGIEIMNEKTFYGLNSLMNFRMINEAGLTDLKADSMFKPFAKNLRKLYFTQKFNKFSKGYNPGNWLKGAIYTKLTDVSFNACYFPNTLNSNSFENLVSVEILSLTWCHISVFQDDTFRPILHTLRRLDLSFNNLKSLSSQQVLSLAQVSETLFLAENEWICECDNEEFIKAIKNDKLKLDDQPKCETPLKLRNKLLADVILSCDTEITKTSTMETTTSTTKSDNESKLEIVLICTLSISENESINTTVKDQLTFFVIKSFTETSVIITLRTKPTGVILYYFASENIESRKHDTVNDNNIVINELIVCQTYIFCVIPSDNDLISPFNCRSHHMFKQNSNQLKKVWLTSSDKTIFITISIIGIIICLFKGIIGMYYLLKKQPALLFSEKIVSNKNQSLKTESIALKIDEEKLNLYLKYYQRSETPASKIYTNSELENLAPDKRAPALPPLNNNQRNSQLSEDSHDPLKATANKFAEVCLEPGGEPCIVSCIVKADDRQSVISWLEKQQASCKSSMDVLFRESSFPDDTFSKADLDGDFTLIILSLSFNALHTINDNSFDKRSMHKLERLIINQKGGNGVERMNEKTFYGLNSLKYFHMVNARGAKELEANSIFKPLAKTLCELYFIQQFNENSKGYDPGNWLKGAEYAKLTNVNFRQNFFPNTLNVNSFVSLKSIEILVLTDCSISVLQPDTFTPIMKTLKQLDLSENKLKSLSPEIVLNFKGINEKIFLAKNNWNCDCDNKMLIEAIKNYVINLADDPKCATPAKWKYVYLDEVNLVGCVEDTTQVTTGVSLSTKPTVEITEMPTMNFHTTIASEEHVNEIEINCFHDNSKNEHKITLTNQIVPYNISSTNETSVQITFVTKPFQFDLLYFIPNKIQSRTYQTIHENVILINNLIKGATYDFCLIPSSNNELTSPFNCRSHHMAQHNLNEVKTVWLTSSDKLVFIALITVAVLSCLIIGLVIVYYMLRRQHKKNCLSQSSAVYQSGDDNLSNYIKYFQRAEIAASKISTTNELENLPPQQRAPALPPVKDSPRLSLRSENSHIYDTVYQKDKDIRTNNNHYLKPQQLLELPANKVSTNNYCKDSSPMEYAPEVPSSILTKSNCDLIMDHFYQSLD